MSLIEKAVGRDRLLIFTGLAIVVVACAWWIVAMRRDMYGAMSGSSAWMMTDRWDAAHLALLAAMWTAMMTGMMLPSAAPTLLLYANVVRKSDDGPHTAARAYAFGAGYLVVWSAFSLAATFVQRGLSAVSLLSPMMELHAAAASAVVLVVAGVYQLTPFKRDCLSACRSPASFITSHWRTGTRGAFRMGVDHGVFCLGCCWALMLLLFAGGVMNLLVIALITLFVLAEKLAPYGAQGGRLSGVLLIAAAIWIWWRG